MKLRACSPGMLSLFVLVACASAARFGPNNCVNLSKSPTGSCVMTTDCVGIDTSKFEFSFDCETAPGQRLRHSFGVGGFDDQEDFDTSIKCSRCIEPVSVQAHQEVVKAIPANMLGNASASTAPRMDNRSTVLEATPTNSVHFLSAGSDDKKVEKKEDAKADKYGPDDCVSTWRDAKSGNCFVQTDCTGKDTTQYLFGLVCEDAEGSKVRHSFGKDSFDAQETFDTLIPCKTCLAMDKVTEATELQAENAELATEINALAGEIGTLKDDFKGVEKDVNKLNEAVATKNGGGEKKEEPKAAEKTEDKAAAETNFYLTDRDVDESYDAVAKSHLKASAVHVKKQHNSQKKRKQRHQKSYDDEAEDDEDDADDEETTPQRNFRHKNHKKSVEKQDKEDSSDDSDDSDDDGKDD